MDTQEIQNRTVKINNLKNVRDKFLSISNQLHEMPAYVVVTIRNQRGKEGSASFSGERADHFVNEALSNLNQMIDQEEKDLKALLLKEI